MKTKLLIFLTIFSFGHSFSQTELNTINAASFENAENTYNYTYWDQGFKNTVSGDRSFTNQTSSFVMNVNYNTLNFNSLEVINPGKTANEAYSELKKETFTNQYAGSVNYSILQNGADYATKPVTNAVFDSEYAEFGTWCNKRFISTSFTISDFYEPYFTGVELVNWHDRFRLTFHLKPTQDITNGRLKFEVEIPSQYAVKHQSDNIYGFSDGLGKGFAIKGDSGAQSITITGNKITVLSDQQNLIAGSSYNVGLIFYALNEDFEANYTTVFTKDSGYSVSVAGSSSKGAEYDANDGVYMIEKRNVNLGSKNCDNSHVRILHELTIKNDTQEAKKARLCFWRDETGQDAAGYNSLLIDKEGNPTGFPMQTSKNWHGGDTKFFSGLYFRDYTELIIPAQTTLNIDYIKTGTFWGTVYGVSSDQLALSTKDGWLEASMGGFGENITHSTEYEFGNTMAADFRPFLVNAAINYSELDGGECDWTGNVGGLDMWCYVNANNTRLYHEQSKVRFKRYSPNLTETSISAVSGDQKMKLDYTFHLNRTDDAMRVYYKVKIRALEAVSFNRFDFFQLGGDNYNHASSQSYAYGNTAGLTSLSSPNCENADALGYTTTAIELTGTSPWIWAGNPIMVAGKAWHKYPGNRGLIVRDYKATINGVESNTPYFRERCKASNQSSSYALVPPPGVSSFSANDEIEFTAEVIILPKQDGDYYGPNTNFAAALTNFGSTWEFLHREAEQNQIIATSATNTINTSYPLSVETSANTGLVKITGGVGYIPLVFNGVTDIVDPTLWKNSGTEWELVDQSYHGKDFWQSDYDTETKTFDLIYNVNQDIANDETAEIFYYLGSSPPQVNFTLEQEEEEIEDFVLYPNPVNDIFRISKKSNKLIIYNLFGQEVYSSDQPNTKFDISNLSAGSYIAKFELEDNKTAIQYFIKE